MKEINNYLDNVFRTFPKTKQILDLKDDILSSMEDRYNELKSSGKSKEEAIGIVISDFGNVDELIKEFDITHGDEREEVAALTIEDVNEYLSVYQRASKFLGIGILLSVIGVSLLILTYQLNDNWFLSGMSDTVIMMGGLIPLLLFVAIATGMFIFAVMIINKYKDIEYTHTLPTSAREYIELKSSLFHKIFVRTAIISIIIIILSPISLFISSLINDFSISYGVVAMLLIIAVALYMIIYHGGIKLSYMTLLKVGAYEKRTNKMINSVAAIVFPLAVIIFLVSGLVFNQWHINWIVFPIAGILYGMFVEAYKIVKEKK